MNVMLFALFAAIGVGLFGHKIERLEMRLVALIATAMVVLYFVRPAFMT